jgi:hypothetical protein
MDEWRGADVRWLRDRAAHIGWLASRIADRQAHEALVALAQDYEDRAAELEGAQAAA